MRTLSPLASWALLIFTTVCVTGLFLIATGFFSKDRDE